MIRTFHHRFTLGAKCGIILCSALAFYLFWFKAVVLALIVSIVVVLMVERVLHSEYVVGEGLLTICRGRFARKQTVALDTIASCKRMRTNFGLSSYLLIETLAGRIYMVQPENEEAFLKALNTK
jgi:hypothetical protein